MSSGRKTELAERPARIAAVRGAQKKAERKGTIILAAVAGVLVLGLAGATIAVVANERATTADHSREHGAESEKRSPDDEDSLKIRAAVRISLGQLPGGT